LGLWQDEHYPAPIAAGVGDASKGCTVITGILIRTRPTSRQRSDVSS